MVMDQKVNNAAGEAAIESTASAPSRYNRAKTWQIAFFAANNTATNIFMFLMANVTYYATGVAGLGTVLVSWIITGSRMWDAVTDPIIGFLMDRTDGKLGKFRPFMIGGWALMSFISILMFFTLHMVPENLRIPYFIFLYIFYIIGYTCQTAVTKAGQSVLTNDPKQRPLFSTFDISYTGIFSGFTGIYLSGYLVPKYGQLNSLELFYEFALTFMILAGILTLLATIGIWSKDRTENFGAGEAKRIKFKDMWTILKGNRPLQMLIVAASTDKLGTQVVTNSIVMVMLFGIIIGDYSMFGVMSAVILLPNVIIAIFGTRIASKFGTKKGLIIATIIAMVSFGSLFFLLWLGDPTQISFDNWGFMTIAFVVLYVFAMGFRTLSSGLAIPMIPDVTDYETYKSGRYAPGVMGTIFSFVDKIVSSFAQTLVGLSLAAIGFTQVFPDVDTAYSTNIFWVTMFLFIGVLMFAWVATLIAMRFYDLDKERMEEIQNVLQDRRETTAQQNNE